MNRIERDRMQNGHLGQQLPAYVNGSLDPTTAAQLDQHLAYCPACQGELAAWQAIAGAARLDATRAPAPPADLLDRVWSRIDRDAVAATVPWQERMFTMIRSNRRRLVRPLVAAAAAAVLAGAVVLTPVGSYAQGFLTVFTPKQIAVVPVTQSELKSLPDLQDYGTVHQPTQASPSRVASAAAAAAAAGYTVLTPASLPSGLGAPHYEVVPSQTGSFTFSAAKAQAAAAAKGKTLPAMPANIDGSTIQVTTGTAVATIYPSTKANPTVSAEGKTAEMPALVVGQMVAPTVQSTGASAQELEQYLLAQPGISPQLAQAIRDIGDPTTTLPIPIPMEKALSHSVQVQGVSGLAVADSTGIGGGIIWEKNGMIYGVAGTYSESQLLSIANSLH